MKRSKIIAAASVVLLTTGAFLVSKAHGKKFLSTNAYFQTTTGGTFKTLFLGAGTIKMQTAVVSGHTAKINTGSGSYVLRTAASTSAKKWYF